MTKQRYEIQFIIQDEENVGRDLGSSFIEDVEDLVREENIIKYSVISSSAVKVEEEEN